MSDYKKEYHGSWIGVDFDGTLATYNGWKGPDVLGEPILEMLGRVSPFAPEGREHWPAIGRAAIVEWCIKHLGCELDITHEKDYLMRELWDDRAIQVRAGTGVTLESEITQLRATIETLKSDAVVLAGEIDTTPESCDSCENVFDKSAPCYNNHDCVEEGLYTPSPAVALAIEYREGK